MLRFGYDNSVMRHLAILFIHLIVTIARLPRPGGARSVVAESLLVKHQLLIINRSRERAPLLLPTDRLIVGLCAILMRPTRLLRSAIVLKPSTILNFHRTLVKRKYRLLFTPKSRGKPGPIGPSPELVSAIVEIKRINPSFGYQRIADQISLVFGTELDKDVVRRVLAKHYRPEPGSDGPSWLTFLGHSKDSLWSVDLFQCESLPLNSHWVMVIMDQFSRRIVGFAVQAGVLDGPTACRMFNSIISSTESPRYLSSDKDPVFMFHRWKSNLRIPEVTEVKTVPYVPLSHPFVERLIGTVGQEYLDQVPFWSARDLGRKLVSFQDYYNKDRVHRALDGSPPNEQSEITDQKIARLDDYRWEKCCRGFASTPSSSLNTISRPTG